MTAAFPISAVEAALASLFPPDVAVAAERVQAGQEGGLWPVEQAAINGAVASRRAEFAAGRLAARRCLLALGRPPVALPMGQDRAAIWPDGLYGTISHAGGIAVAVIGETGPLGVDIEEDAALEPALWPVICSPEELSALPGADTGRWVRRAFAGKEAVFKAQHPTRRAMFGFDAVDIRLTETDFTARFRLAVGGFAEGQEVHGRLAYSRGLTLAGAVT
ncbi:4'-phosphopantetheinyl transferase superfamily protein [Tabrizicola piscis]|uniref:Enterobactin synthase component D n=1 Tax=Tabrizicola piscis TaxID=2494374 RepID=A0A3S8UA93_9RHOB|nr:4'-phosphopantetheinyl transferase superfamily protein [Tabrizicola piscis]AZL60491.1 4'-phosphopantetheinyl transferase superfamily protein [Tabrizicola piscis]